MKRLFLIVLFLFCTGIVWAQSQTEDWYPAYRFTSSPNGSLIAFKGDDGKIIIFDYDNGETTTLPDRYTGHLIVSWSPDGQKLLLSTEESLEVVDLRGNLIFDYKIKNLHHTMWEANSQGIVSSTGNDKWHFHKLALQTTLTGEFGEFVPVAWNIDLDQIVLVKHQRLFSFLVKKVDGHFKTIKVYPVIDYRYQQCSYSPVDDLVACVHIPSSENQRLTIVSLEPKFSVVSEYFVGISGYFTYDNGVIWSPDGQKVYMRTNLTCCTSHITTYPFMVADINKGWTKILDIDGKHVIDSWLPSSDAILVRNWDTHSFYALDIDSEEQRDYP